MDGKSSDWRPTPTVCRCCLAEGCYKDISTEYFWMGKREVYAEMLSETFDISIAYSQSGGPNSNSRLICEPCISRLRDATEFKRQVQECEKTFMQHLDPGRPSVTDLDVPSEPADKDVKLERVKQEKEASSDDDFDDRPEMPDDDDDDDLDDQPLTKLASKVPKKESVDFLDLLDNSKAAEKRKSTIKVKATPVKKAKTKTIEVKPTASKVKSPEKKKKENPKETTTNAGRLNAEIILKHSTAYTFQPKGKSYGCCFCPIQFEDPAELRQHSDTQHPFVDKTAALNRMHKNSQLRVDITDLRCIQCCNKFTDLEVLAKHLHDDHNIDIDVDKGLGLVPLKLEKDRFECVICSMKLSGYTQLSKHSGDHFVPDKVTFTCSKCDKVFAKRGQVYFHFKAAHTDDYKCQYCGMRFQQRRFLAEHVAVRHTREPIYKCSVCDKSFMTMAQVYKHRAVHENSIKHICAVCNSSFETSTALKYHTKKEHSDAGSQAAENFD